MPKEEAIEQLAQLMTYNEGMTGEEPDYVTVWNRIQDLTDYVLCHEPYPGDWEPSEGFKAFLERTKS